jgi:hypothetical protein
VAHWLLAGAPENVLRVATTWSRAERGQLEDEYREWTNSPGADRSENALKLEWLEVSASAPGAINDRYPRADLLLGGPVSEYVRLARAGKLLPMAGAGSPLWYVAKRRSIGSHDVSSPGAPFALRDPRVSPPTLVWAQGELSKGSWLEGYALLVRVYGHDPQSIVWPSGSPASLWEEGAAAFRGTTKEPLALAFLRFLVERRGAAPGVESRELDPNASDLLAELLGATLIDAQEELRAAWTALDRAGSRLPSPALNWMAEPPPWPPASVEQLQSRTGDRAMVLVHDLAGQIAPDPEARFWLVQSWLRPPRSIDGSFLEELARAAGGRLVREPRFRAWLRAEWTAWARQRYRRIARVSAAGLSSLPAGSGTTAP